MLCLLNVIWWKKFAQIRQLHIHRPINSMGSLSFTSGFLVKIVFFFCSGLAYFPLFISPIWVLLSLLYTKNETNYISRNVILDWKCANPVFVRSQYYSFGGEKQNVTKKFFYFLCFWRADTSRKKKVHISFKLWSIAVHFISWYM